MMDTSSPFVINVSELRQGAIDVELDEAPSHLDLEVEDAQFVGRVTGRLSWRWVSDRVVALGRLRATAQMQCVRCLRELRQAVEVEARLVYSDEPSPEEKVVDLDVDDEGVTHYQGEWIDAREDVRAFLLLELPDIPLCSETCKGLCPRCGADLNDGPCDCAEAKPDDSPEWKKQLSQIREEL